MTKKVIEISSGGVIFKKSGNSFEIALISKRKGKIWCLPKGHVEEGEHLTETAVREVKEETGLTGEVLDKIGDIIYWYSNKDKKGDLIKIFKRVYFFLIKYINGETQNHDLEVEDVQWVTIEKACKILSYNTEKGIVEKAEKILKEKFNP
ncbi:MAG: hypothetical protein A3C43_03255 [Candidatus Schekmanbacteria bacterium RIFCSPHIGHO2_02_FULL_38_11]|uniref:Nudix hydrolase domain-containing protein n=1 Tax=Candidatus Schekmanbacteria bacterium RIFCSPLOWO2_12_FULL_38_15 TaxID=1817883 RepID=A0A1F7SN72_9BACT|nr:MAG: hypothetical protein A2043_03020 [Candidatus Schekmanbacteria bacterium GWA2_38_9]OGL50110.1 MAG: hypothetical protein A3H37_07340 [Candidatus Schekmanbacteria bacterium RIFCSPLOWO2_02_FULL_38_14]OGL54296.1 MAG: hypothetical protein A3C43_03255 [Candidatus Schekmanbacteria bacterium RIFCSPHIGHO2_02_FULL_38_11]OGL55221.1 MAG: hypothetical protein A3G31_09635 [Candidatus Schekmanbacteria bacterium RIFCSPLOWO2_12_FULL_38_15]